MVYRWAWTCPRALPAFSMTRYYAGFFFFLSLFLFPDLSAPWLWTAVQSRLGLAIRNIYGYNIRTIHGLDWVFHLGTLGCCKWGWEYRVSERGCARALFRLVVWPLGGLLLYFFRCRRLGVTLALVFFFSFFFVVSRYVLHLSPITTSAQS